MNISTITIKLNIEGDAVKDNLTFTPSMVNPDMKETTIYIPHTFKLSESLIKKAVKESSSVKEILTTPSMFQVLVRYSTDRAKGYKRISLKEAEEKGITDSNYQFMKNLWLKKGQRIFIDDRAYDIITSKIQSTTNPESRDKLKFNMTVNLRVIQSKRNTLVNRTKMSCDDKRNEINELVDELFGVPFFTYRNPSLKQGNAPVMYSSAKTGIATAKSPGKAKKQPTNPFVAPYQNKLQGVAPLGMMPAAAIPVAYAIPVQQTPSTSQVAGKKRKKMTRRRRRRKARSNTSKHRA
tara:strand:+ start:931 stop:1812 length:882 start_codon:yes stop_codon:yes gene_type:complete